MPGGKRSLRLARESGHSIRKALPKGGRAKDQTLAAWRGCRCRYSHQGRRVRRVTRSLRSLEVEGFTFRRVSCPSLPPMVVGISHSHSRAFQNASPQKRLRCIARSRSTSSGVSVFFIIISFVGLVDLSQLMSSEHKAKFSPIYLFK